MKAASSDKLADKDCFYRFILHIIPVIDLLNGICVHAKKGERTRYQPIQSSLTNSYQAIDIVKAFMHVYPFKTLYIADLNAIQGLNNTGKAHREILAEIQQTFPKLNLWVDAGTNTIENAKNWLSLNVQLVLGSESFNNIAEYEVMQQQIKQPFTLSLDFDRQGYRGPHGLLEDTSYWPTAVIAMTLSRVGANSGVDLATITKLVEKSHNQAVYAAGGIRDIDDLLTIKKLGVKGALIASALHNRSLSTQAIEQLMP